MPVKNDHITHEKWAECALCGFDYPLSMMWKRAGRIVCREACQDENRLNEAESMATELAKVKTG